MKDYVVVFRNEDDLKNEIFNRINIPVPRIGETVYLLDSKRIPKKYLTTNVRYIYSEKFEDYCGIEVFVKSQKE